MSPFRNVDLFDPSPSLLAIAEPSIFRPQYLDFTSLYQHPDLSFPHHVFHTFSAFSSPSQLFPTLTDLTHVEKTPFSTYCNRTVYSAPGSGILVRSLRDRVSAQKEEDRKYTWTAEIKKNGIDQSYKWTTEIKGSEKKGFDRKYKWTAEIGGAERNGAGRKYTWAAELKGGKKEGGAETNCEKLTAGKHKEVPIIIKEVESFAGGCSGGAGKDEIKKKKKKKKGECATRVVEIEVPVDQGALFLRQAFAKRAGAIAKAKGKNKVLTPQDAALIIQMSFRAYLIRRSKALRSLRQLAAAKVKLKEIRTLFNNYSYRQRIARDAEEHQRFSERIIVLLLTVDAVEGVDLMVRASRGSMLDELEAILDVVDPQPPGKRRMFNLPESGVQNEIAAGVAEVVQMLDEAGKYENSTFEVCL